MTIGLVGQHHLLTFPSPVNGPTPVDSNQIRSNDNQIVTAFDAHDSDATIHVQTSTLASRPAAADAGAGAVWLTSDTYRLYYDDGAAWHEAAYLPTSGGAVSGQLVVSAAVVGDYVVKIHNTSAAATAFGMIVLAESTSATDPVLGVGNNSSNWFRVFGDGHSVFGGAVAITGTLQIGNAYVAGVVAPTGTIKITDSTGTVYRVACAL